MEKFDVLNEQGEFTGKTATRDECHEKGLWHRAIYAFIIDKDFNVLLQKRSENKKLWPGRWDVSFGGHVNAGEFGRATVKRECKEELGIDIDDSEIKYIVSTVSKYNKNGYINNHFDECYIVTKDVDLKDLRLQSEEVTDVAYFPYKDVIKMIDNNYENITEKDVSWGIFKKIMESDILKNIKK